MRGAGQHQKNEPSVDPSEVESLSKINYRTEGIKMKADVNDGEETIRQRHGGLSRRSVACPVPAPPCPQLILPVIVHSLKTILSADR